MTDRYNIAGAYWTLDHLQDDGWTETEIMRAADIFADLTRARYNIEAEWQPESGDVMVAYNVAMTTMEDDLVPYRTKALRMARKEMTDE